MEYFQKFHSNTLAGSGNQSFFLTDDANTVYTGRVFYKIFADEEELQSYLKKNPDKRCPQDAPVFSVRNYKEYSAAKVRKLSADEAEKYLSERGETTL